MPLVAIPALVIGGGLLWQWVSGLGQQAADAVTQPPPQQSSGLGLPGWVIPAVIVGIIAILAYKEGAKLLKV